MQTWTIARSCSGSYRIFPRATFAWYSSTGSVSAISFDCAAVAKPLDAALTNSGRDDRPIGNMARNGTPAFLDTARHLVVGILKAEGLIRLPVSIAEQHDLRQSVMSLLTRNGPSSRAKLKSATKVRHKIARLFRVITLCQDTCSRCS